jgi:putative membrane protein insertion efficiency factor
VHNAALFLILIPRNIGVLLIRGYRAVISPLYGDVCRYYPSCSAYGLGSVQQRGLLVGTALTAWRIVRCNPWSRGGVDEVRAPKHDRYRVTSFGWVVPAGFAGTDASPSTFAQTPHVHTADDHSSHVHSPDSSRGDAELTFSSPIVSRKD